MTLIKCSECDKDVSDKARACPNCGNPINEEVERVEKSTVELVTSPQRLKHRARFVLFAIIFILGLILFFIGFLNNADGLATTGFFAGLIGFLGMAASKLGLWFAQP